MKDEKQRKEAEEELEALRKALPDYEIEPHSWKRGDPVKNNADLIAKNLDDQAQMEERLLPFGVATIVAKDGTLKDLNYTAPERVDWDATETYHESIDEDLKKAAIEKIRKEFSDGGRSDEQSS